MKELTEPVFASDNEDQAANARDCLKENNIKCTVRINTNNQMFGRGVLNDGEIITGGSYEVMQQCFICCKYTQSKLKDYKIPGRNCLM